MTPAESEKRRFWPRVCENYFAFVKCLKSSHESGFLLVLNCVDGKRERSHARFVFEPGVFTRPR